MSKIRVLYIAGLGRSGTTLIDRLLGEVDGFVSAGELRHIWARSYKDNQLCGCRRNFIDCKIWQSISNRAFPGGLTDEALSKVLGLQKKLNRIRALPFLDSNALKKDVCEYMDEFLYPLYSAIDKEFPGHVIVDSSKVPSYLYILKKCEFIDLSVIHVVRDPRAVAFSWLRKKKRPEVVERDEYMPMISPFRISALWVLFNSLIRRLGNSLGENNYRIISYEEFSRFPSNSISALSEFAGNTEAISIFRDSNTAFLKENHSVSGNPMRFKTGLITIKTDEEWRVSMRKRDKFFVSFLTIGHKNSFRN